MNSKLINKITTVTQVVITVFFNVVVGILYQNIEQLPEVAAIASKLEKEFRKLSVDVQRSVESVDLDEVKLIINLALEDNIRHVSTDMYLKTLEEIDSVKKIFPFLIKSHFVGYLNYGLLKEISELVENTEVKEKFDHYESEYKHLLSASTFNLLMQAFLNYPDLSPTTAVGLSEIMFRLDNPWPEGSMLTWQEYLKSRFPNWADSLAPKELSSECIIVTYAILPSALPAALKDLRDPAVLMELEDIGVTVVQLPDVLKNGNESTGIY